MNSVNGEGGAIATSTARGEPPFVRTVGSHHLAYHSEHVSALQVLWGFEYLSRSWPLVDGDGPTRPGLT